MKKRTSKIRSKRYIWQIVILSPCLILAGGGGWLIGSASGLQWLVGIVERQSGGNLSASGISGSLIDTCGVQLLELRGDDWRVTLRGLQLEWQPAALLRGELEVLHLSARQVEILSLPSDTPTVLPDSLALPLKVNVLQMKIDTFSVTSSENAKPDFTANDIQASFKGDDRLLKLLNMRANPGYGNFVGSGELALNRPYVLKAQGTFDAELSFSGKPEHAHFAAETGGDLEHIGVKLEGGGAGIRVNGTIQIAPLANVTVSRMEIAFIGMDAARMIEGAPAAILAGNVDLHGTPAGGLDGTMQIHNAHAAPLDQYGLPISGMTSRLRWSSSQLLLQQLNVRLPNEGHISGMMSWETQHGQISAELNVSKLDPAALDTRLPTALLQGDIKLDGKGEELRATVALSDASLDVQAALARHGDQMELSSIRVTRGGTELTGHGQLVMDRRRTFRFSSRIRKLDISEFADFPATNLNAGMEMSGTLLPQAQGALQVNLSDSHFAQSDVSGNGHIEISGKKHATGKAELRFGDNRLNLEGAYGTPADRIHLSLDAPDLGQFGYGLAGQLAGRADLSGNLIEPRLEFSVQGAHLSLPGGQRISALDATADLSAVSMQLNLDVKDYRGKDAINVPHANIGLQGSREQHSLHATSSIAQGDDMLGDLSLKVSGGLSDPARGWQTLQWRGSIDELAAQGVLPFHLLAAAPLSLGKDSFQLGTADLAVAGGQIQLTDLQWTPQRLYSAGKFSSLNVRAVNMQQNKFVLDTFDSMRFDGSWEAQADEHWQGRFQVQGNRGEAIADSKAGFRLGLRDMKLSVRAEQDQLQAQLEASGEHLGELKIGAHMPMTRTDTGWTILTEAPLAGQLHLHSDDLSWLGPMLDGNLQSGGRLNLDAELVGSFRSPRLQGEVQGEALILAMLDQGIRLEQGELKVRIEPDAVHVDRFSFSAPYQRSPRDKLLEDYTLPAGIGKLNANGRIDLEGGKGDLNITADHLPLAQRADRWIIASGSGHARFANNILLLDGNIRADAGLINQPVSDRPRWSEDVQIIGKEAASRVGPPISMNATLELGDHFYLRASGLEARLAGQLKVRDEPGEPLRVIGIIAAHDALFDAYGQRLQVERGIVNFQGPLDDPGLNILSLRKGLSVEAGVEVTGTVRRPKVRLVSTPNVPDGEKLSWIILGRVPESSGVDTSLLMAAAGSILGGQTVGKFGETLGVDEISLSQKTGADAQQVEKVTVGKQLSARARISYEQGLTEVGGVTKFIYTLTPRITIVTRTGTEDALDLFYTISFY